MAEERIQLKFVTPVFRASFVHIIEPASNLAGDLEYALQMIFEPGTDFSLMKMCFKNALTVKFGSDPSKWPKPLSLPLRNGNLDRPDDDLYADCLFAKGKSWTKPGLVDSGLNEIIDPNEIYSGMYARASLFPHVYVKPRDGITLILNNVQKVRDGERLDGRASAQEDFADFISDSAPQQTVSAFNIFD